MWPANFFQRTVSPNTISMDMDTAGKTKGDLATNFSTIGVIDATQVVIRRKGENFEPIKFAEVPDDATYLRRAAINTGRGAKGKTHAFQYK